MMVVTAMGRRGRLARQQKAAPVSPEAMAKRLREAGRQAVLQGNLVEAEKAFSKAVNLGTKDADVYNNLAIIYDRWGVKPDDQLELLRKAYALAPDGAEIRSNYLSFLGKRASFLVKEGRHREALPLVLRRVELEPDSASAHRELGCCYQRTGKPEDAMKQFARAINRDPSNACYYNDLGLVCYEMRLLAEAQGAFQEVLRLNPKSVVAYTHLGLLANLTGLTGLAIKFLRRALEVDPHCSEAQNNIALFLRDQGEQSACRYHYEQSMRLRPENANVLSGYLLSLNDDPKAEPAWVASEHVRFQKMIKGPRRELRPRDLDPARKLRVGYLSPDFRMHSVAFFVAPVLAAHAGNAVDVTCYATGNMEDEMTERIKGVAGKYQKVYCMSDEDLAALIQDDGIDVLVDLSGHTSDNRLLMLGNRVAPVQMTYLGYPNTTGLTEMDLRVTDAIADPPGQTEAWHSEKLVRIEGGFLAYHPLPGADGLAAVPLPARQAGHVTFGSFNNLAKMNDVVLETWAAILEQVPGSAILLKARGLRNDEVKERILTAFAARGIEGENRIQLMGHERSSLDHLRLYNQMDLALDTFPYNGTTTTCEALWMGTPVLTFTGESHASRVGASLLMHTGLGELVAEDRQGYIARAVALGRDWDALAKVRMGLREKFASSPVMDAARLARGLEKAYREAWQAYCASPR
jgi:predicted O-linked N-acetylglucosamine transferase (SPINDLY family)